jgi:hypothetical protein
MIKIWDVHPIIKVQQWKNNIFFWLKWKKIFMDTSLQNPQLITTSKTILIIIFLKIIGICMRSEQWIICEPKKGTYDYEVDGEHMSYFDFLRSRSDSNAILSMRMLKICLYSLKIFFRWI